MVGAAIMRLVGRLYGGLILRFNNALRIKPIKASFKSCGKDVNIAYGCSFFGAENMSFGDHVYIGNSSVFLSVEAAIVVGNYVMFGPEVAIVTGNHRFNVVGKYMYNVAEKQEGDDQDVIIEDDVWIGMRATILKGVRIGKGSIVGACSVVNKDVEPYTIVVGNPAKKVRMRFTPDEIIEHEKGLSRGKQTRSNVRYE